MFMKFKEFSRKLKEQEEQEEKESVNYADALNLKSLAAELKKSIPQGEFSVRPPKAHKTIPHIRAQKISQLELQNAMKKFGAEKNTADLTQSVLSGKFPVHSFTKDNITYSIVIGSVKGAKGEESIGLNRKELTPGNLGLAGRPLRKQEIINTTKSALMNKIRDEGLRDALIALIDNAAQGGNNKLSPEQQEEIKPLLGIISQDLGEILAPIMIMSDDDVAEYESGPTPLYDVKIKNVEYSVKALTGSGTSFRSVSKLMDQYEQELKDPETIARFNVLKQFHPSTGGKNVDKIIRAAKTANIPEYLEIMNILGVSPEVGMNSYSDLVTQLKTFTADLNYSQFLNAFYPAMEAGNWGKPVGLPADGLYYLGRKEKPPKKEKSAGKNSYNANPSTGAADILTYVMGIGLLNFIRQGNDAEKYRSMITDILKKKEAQISHIKINPDGTLVLNTKPFSTTKFEFQYHAPSHIPGNNLPGFIHVPG